MTGRSRRGGRRPRVPLFGLIMALTASGLGPAALIARADPPADVPGPSSAAGAQPVIVESGPSDGNDAPPEPDVVASADLQVSKSSNTEGILRNGDELVYTIAVRNVGAERATGVEVHDVLPAGVEVRIPPLPSFDDDFCTVASSVVLPGIPVTTVDCGPASLDTGETASVEIHARVSGMGCGSLVNSVDVEGANEPGPNVGEDNHAETLDEVACVPRIRLLKRGPRLAHVGDVATYRFAATNTGGVDLTGVELSDPACEGPPSRDEDGDGDAVLAAGETWSYRCDRTIVAADGSPVRNEATVRATHQGGTVSDSDGHDIVVIHPGIRIEKTATPTSGAPGAHIVYAYTVTNTGDTTLFDISVDDDVLGRIGVVRSLPAGRTAALTHSFTLGSSPVTNLGTAEGKDGLGRSVLDSDAVTDRKSVV